MPLAFRLYWFFTGVFTPLFWLLGRIRHAKGKEIKARLTERFGVVNVNFSRSVVWVHAASIGEMLAVMPLIEKLVLSHDVLLTTMTKTSAELACARLPQGAHHRFVPYDNPFFVKRFLDEVKPCLTVFTEQELWVNLIVETKARGVPLVLVNARMSSKSFTSWLKYPKLIKALLGQFSQVLAQSELDCERFKALGFSNAKNLGNMKYDVFAENTRLNFTGRLVWLAASTHEGEEAAAMRLHARLKPHFPSLLTLIAPRHIERCDDILSGISIARRSKGEEVTPLTDIYLCDTFGEMPLFYASSRVTFMGKSLYASGGQNPLEAIRACSVVISGMNIANFEEIYISLKDAIYSVVDENALYEILFALLSNDDLCQSKANEARLLLSTFEGAVSRTYNALGEYIS